MAAVAAVVDGDDAGGYCYCCLNRERDRDREGHLCGWSLVAFIFLEFSFSQKILPCLAASNCVTRGGSSVWPKYDYSSTYSIKPKLYGVIMIHLPCFTLYFIMILIIANNGKSNQKVTTNYSLIDQKFRNARQIMINTKFN